MAKLKVSIDEWVVIDYAQVDVGFCVWTDGLSGCVGVVIVAGSKVFLTHVSSELADGNKAQYLKALQVGLDELGKGSNVSNVFVMLGGDSTSELNRGETVLSHINEWMNKTGGKDADVEPDPGYSGVAAHVRGPAGKSWGFEALRNLGAPKGSTDPFLTSAAAVVHKRGELPNFKGVASEK